MDTDDRHAHYAHRGGTKLFVGIWAGADGLDGGADDDALLGDRLSAAVVLQVAATMYAGAARHGLERDLPEPGGL